MVWRLLVLVGVAVYIRSLTGSRYFDERGLGVDVTAGSPAGSEGPSEPWLPGRRGAVGNKTTGTKLMRISWVTVGKIIQRVVARPMQSVRGALLLLAVTDAGTAV